MPPKAHGKSVPKKEIRKELKKEHKKEQKAPARQKTSGQSLQRHVVLSQPVSRLVQSAHAQAPEGELFLPVEGSPPSQTYCAIIRRQTCGTNGTGFAAAYFFPYRMACSDFANYVQVVGSRNNAPNGNSYSAYSTQNIQSPIVASNSTTNAWSESTNVDMAPDFSISLPATVPATLAGGIGSVASMANYLNGDRYRLVKATARVKYTGTSLTNAGFPMWVPVSSYTDLWAQTATGAAEITYSDLMNVPGVVEFEIKDSGWHSFSWLPTSVEDCEYLPGVSADFGWYNDDNTNMTEMGTVEAQQTGTGEQLFYATYNFSGDPTDALPLPLGYAFSFMPFMFICVAGEEGVNWMCEMEANFERIGTSSSNLVPRVPDEPGMNALLAHTGSISARLYTGPGEGAAAAQRTLGHVASAMSQTSQVVHGTVQAAQSVADSVGGVVVQAGHIAKSIGEAAEVAAGIGSLFL